MGGLLQQPTVQEEPSSLWRVVVAGTALVVVAVGIIAVLNRAKPAPGPAVPDAYAANLQIADLKMSQAQNFVGATVTYIDGAITNQGTQTVTGATVEVSFRNSLNEVVQREQLPLRVLQTGGPYPDAVDLKVAPLTPGKTDLFRLTFEHVSADWNQAYPEVRILQVSTK
jgi:hypothetical protein